MHVASPPTPTVPSLPEARLGVEHFIERRTVATAAIGGVLYTGLYSLPNQHPLFQPHAVAGTWPDLALTFQPWTIWIYLTAYPMLLVAFLAVAVDHRVRFVAAFSLVTVIGTTAHLVFPVAIARPPLPVGTGPLTTQAFHLLRSLDSSLSCLPSLHVAGALLAALAIERDRPRTSFAVLGLAGLIAVSTLTTRQHYALDVASGAVLGLFAYWVFYAPMAQSGVQAKVPPRDGLRPTA